MYILFITLLSFIYSFEITGFVSDGKNNRPISGVNIYIYNSNLGTSSNTEGQFTFTDIELGEYMLKFSHIGYDDYFVKLKIDENVKIFECL